MASKAPWEPMMKTVRMLAGIAEEQLRSRACKAAAAAVPPKVVPSWAGRSAMP